VVARVPAPSHVVAPLLALFVASARGQQLVNTESGGSGQELGFALAGGPDLDGDGIGDVAIGAPSTIVGRAGTVEIHSGRNFSTLAVLTGAANEEFGRSLCWCGDLDGDGLSELAVGVSAGAGVVRIFKSSNWKRLRALTTTGSDNLGWSLAAAGDHDGDGFDDLYVGDRGVKSVGAVTLFSGKDGSILQSIAGTTSHAGFGQSVAVAGDANGDGVADVAIGSPFLDVTAQNDDSGAVDFRSGADGSLLWQELGSYQIWYDGYGNPHYNGDHLGIELDAAGDVDGDGALDVVVATQESEYVEILSGANGSTLRSATIFKTAGALAAMGDLTGDGLPEFGVSSGYVDTPFVILSSFDSKVLWRGDTYAGDPPRVIAPTSDIDGDGLPDLLLGFPYDGANFDGRAEQRTTNDLWLDVSSHHPSTYAGTIELRANEGPTGNLAALVLTGFDSTPTFLPLVFVAFDASRSALFYSGPVPTGLSGHVLSLRAIAIGPSGRLIQSLDELVAPH
jgi:VCBS repeat protein/FG-GAP repeat protein